MKGPIFIGGCGSSGTTLLRKMINAHPNIGCGPEMSVFDRPKMYDISISHLYTLFIRDDFDELDDLCVYPIRFQPMDKSYCGLSAAGHRRFYYDGEDTDAVFEELFDNSNSPKEFLQLFFDRWANESGKKRWAEKTPNNIFTAGKILETYRHGKFINVIRDGRDVVLSLTGRRGTPVYTAIWRWLAATEAGLRMKGHPRFLTVRYEDLVLQTESTLKGICSFIGVDYDAAMLDFWKLQLPEDNDSGINPTADYGKQPVFEKSIGKWKDEKVNRTIMLQMDFTLRDRLRALKYE